MAVANIKTFCSSCGKQNGRVTCEGCSKLFCFNDFNIHRQELGTQLDQIEVDRDLFRQMLTENISKPQNQALMKQIDQWENKSINKIRQAAEEARRILIKDTAELNTKLEEKLEILTNELRQSRQENDFFEPKLNQWKEELAHMNHDLTKPSNITIRNDSTPLVTKIVVGISDERYNNKRSETTPAPMRILCSFCNEECSASAIKEHLMTCGNKTDQCPNCKKYIRRAIFAYHTENNCASLDESEPAGGAVANRPQSFSTFQLNYPPPSSLRPSATNDKTIKVRASDLATFHNPQTVPTSQQSNSEGRVTNTICPYCNLGGDPLDFDIHQENCLRNPKNIEKKQQPQPIYRADGAVAAPCKYCNKQYMIAFIEQHERLCKQNPDNIALEEQLRAIYYSPAPKYTPHYY